MGKIPTGTSARGLEAKREGVPCKFPTGVTPSPSLLALQGSAASLRPQDSQNLLTVRKISVSRMHSLPNDSYMFRPVTPAKAPFPLHEVEMETYPCKAQRGTTHGDFPLLWDEVLGSS